MNKPIFSNGITGLSDTKWMGEKGNAHKLVGVDFRSSPGIFKAQQKLKKISEVVEKEGETNVVTSLCDIALDVSDGSKLWFSSDNGKIWKQSGDTFSLIHTFDIATDYKEPNSVTEIINEDKIDYTATMSISENNFDYGKVYFIKEESIDSVADETSSCVITDSLGITVYNKSGGDAYFQGYSMWGDFSNPTFAKRQNFKFYSNGVNSIRDTSICGIDDTHFIVAYCGGSILKGWVETYSISDIGYSITNLDKLELAENNRSNSIIKIDDTHFVLASEIGSTGSIKILEIDGSYEIIEIKSLIHDTDGAAEDNNLIKIDDTHFILAYTRGGIGYIKTFSIDGSYEITEEYVLQHTSGVVSWESDFIKLDDTHYAIAMTYFYNGIVSVFEINEDYEISKTASESMGAEHQYNTLLLLSSGDFGYYVLFSGDNYGNTQETKTLHITKDNEIKIINESVLGYSGSGNKLLKLGGYPLIISEISSGVFAELIKIDEVLSAGVVIKSTGGEANIFYEASKTSVSAPDKKITMDIKIPEGHKNTALLVVVGSANKDSDVTSIKLGDDTLTEVLSVYEDFGFQGRLSYYIITNPSDGELEVVLDNVDSTIRYPFVIAMAIENTNQVTTIGDVDYGWKNFLTLDNASNNDIRVGAFFTKKNTHTLGAYDNPVANFDVAGGLPYYSVSVSTRGYNTGTAKILGASEFSYTEPEIVASDEYDYRPEQTLNKIYYCNENILFAVPVDKIDSWSDNIEVIGSFKNGHDTYHPMVNQNLELYIGDDNVMAKVDVNGIFNQETLFNIKSPDKIQTISTFDTDLLVGVVGVNKSKILRWDTFSQSWSAEDEVFETGINAFIKDDNYTYVSAGDYGRIYFYNGEKLELYKRIPGDFSSTKKATINSNSVGFINGHTIFGLSNSSNNPTEQGVYCLGSYDSKYPKSLSLDYPVPTNELTGVSLGAIIVNGSDMYVSYKTSTDVGIAKIDHSNKYNGAYLETMQLTSLVERDDDSIVERIVADYVSMPDNTSVAISTKTKYDTDYTEQTLLVDTDKMSVRTKNSIPKISSLQVKLELTTSGNDSPEIENLGII